MSILTDVKHVIGDTLQLGDRVNSFDENTILLGALPELDSMAVVAVINALEEFYQFTVYDDDIDANTFQSVGSLVNFVEQKLASSAPPRQTNDY